MNKSFLLCRLCLNELIDSFLDCIDIFLVVVPVSQLKVSPKKGSRLLLTQLLCLECPSNEGSVFKRLMAGMIMGL